MATTSEPPPQYEGPRRQRQTPTFVSWLELAAPLLFLLALAYLALRALRGGAAELAAAETISRVAGWAVPLLSSSVALGFVVMAIIQLIKPPVRAAFHSRELKRWLSGTLVREYFASPSLFLGNFLHLVSSGGGADPREKSGPRGRDYNALLELPIEQLTAQIQAASEMVLASGRSNDDWFVYALVSEGEARSHFKRDFAGEDAELRERTRLSYLIQRRLDAIQIQARRRWRQWLRALAFGVGLALTSTVAGVLGLWEKNFLGTLFLVLLLSAVGGFFASVARDAVAIVERLRG